MNKLTKLLSVFVIAGAIGTGAGALAGCSHKHTFSSDWTNTDPDQHWHAATCEHSDEKADVGAHEFDNDQDADCNVCGYERTVNVKVTGVTLDKATATIDSIGGKVQLNATVAPTNATNKNVTWFSSNTEVATVSNGEVTAVASGETTITVTTVDGAKAAECVVTVHVPVTGVTVKAEGEKAEVMEGSSLKLIAEIAPETATNKGVTWSITEGAEFATIDAETGVITGVDGGDVKVKATSAENAEISGELTVTVKALFKKDTDGARLIETKEQLLAFRNLATLKGTYRLKNDIDLTGEVLAAPKAVVGTGIVFDGAGKTISNATYADAESKSGLLLKMINGGTVTNIKFLNCAVTSANETAAILAGECEGTSTVSKIEFNSCSIACGNYGGFVAGRNEKGDANITVSEITTKNGCTLTCAQYGGMIIGDIQGSSTFTSKDLHLDGEIKGSSGNGSFVAGRTRAGATVTIENAVLSATIPDKNSFGLFSGNGSCKKLTIKNVLVIKSNVALMWQTNRAPTAAVVENVVTLPEITVNDLTKNPVAPLPQTGANTVAYLKDTLSFDFAADTGVWMEEGEGAYRLRAASTNVKSPDATLVTLKVNASNAPTRFKKDDTFDSTGLSVMGLYSDGVQLVLQEGTGYTVDTSTANMSEKGEYTATVKSVEDPTKTQTYTFNVVEETGFRVADEFMAHTYLANGKLDTANLVVYSVWSDGEEEVLKADDYTIDETSYNMANAGEQSVWVKYGTYEKQTIAITVIAAKPTVTEGKVTVNVDKASKEANGTLVSGVATFKTLVDAIRYLEACDLGDDVVKVVNVAAGEYKAKITTDLSNLTLIGANTATEDKSILTYSAVESTVDIVTGAQYGLKCATLHIKGENFTAKNITIRNDFDYIKDNKKESSPQGLALTIEGDKAVLENCHLYGNQDTLYLRKGRAYFNKTLIEGNIDFIFGEAVGIAFFEECEIRSITKSEKKESNNGYVTAMKAEDSNKPDYGYIFYKCNFTDDGKLADGSMSLGRPWGPKATVAYIECSFTKAYSKLGYDGSAKSRWFDMSGNKPQNADFCEYKSTGEGAITTAVDGGKILTDAQAANYTKENIFAMTNGKCTWTTPWAGTNEKVAVTVNYDTDKTLTVMVEKNVKLTEELAEDLFAVEGYAFKGLYTDAACTAAFDYATAFSEAKSLYGKYEKVAYIENTYTFSYAAIDKTKLTAPDSTKPTEFDKAVLTSEHFTGVNAFLTVVKAKAVTWRKSNDCIENKDGGLEVEFKGTGTITITFASTGGGNKSRLGLKDESGAYVKGVASAADEGAVFVEVATGDEAGAIECGDGVDKGTKKVTVTFTVTKAGKYTIVCPSAVTGRGARIMGIVMYDKVPNAS